jgi:hypothetical protein
MPSCPSPVSVSGARGAWPEDVASALCQLHERVFFVCPWGVLTTCPSLRAAPEPGIRALGSGAAHPQDDSWGFQLPLLLSHSGPQHKEAGAQSRPDGMTSQGLTGDENPQKMLS